MTRLKNKAAGCLMLTVILFLSCIIPYNGGNLAAASAAENENAEGGGLEIRSQAGVLMEFSTGDIILSQNETELMHPASLTKIMTILLTYEAVEEGWASWDDTVVVSENAWRQGGSQMFLNVDQKVSLEELVKGVIIVSANDACVAIAEHLSGYEELFVKEMNEKARELGLDNTRFQNPSGLPEEDHYTSAEDTAIMAKYLVEQYPEALELYSTAEFKFNEIEQQNRNPLLERFEGADGIKTGYTSKAGYNLVGTAERDGMRFISVVLQSESNTERLEDSQSLLSHGFRNYTLLPLVSENELIKTAAVTGGVEQEVELLSEKDIEVVVPVDRKNDVEIRVDAAEEITAPLEKGQPVGKMEVTLDDEQLSETELYTAESIERAGITTRILRWTVNFFYGLWDRLTGAVSELIFAPIDSQ